MFFVLGAALYAAVPAVGRAGDVGLFCAVFCVILTMYGGGFAAIPAYLADLFGTGFVGAIHGRLLTAWSAAGVVGPVLVNYVNEQQLRAGVPRAAAYDRTMMILAGLLVAGAICNAFVRAVPAADSEACDGTDTGPAVEDARHAAKDGVASPAAAAHGPAAVRLAAFWLLVTLPLAWGLLATIRQAAVLFG